MDLHSSWGSMVDGTVKRKGLFTLASKTDTPLKSNLHLDCFSEVFVYRQCRWGVTIFLKLFTDYCTCAARLLRARARCWDNVILVPLLPLHHLFKPLNATLPHHTLHCTWLQCSPIQLNGSHSAGSSAHRMPQGVQVLPQPWSKADQCSEAWQFRHKSKCCHKCK